MRWSVARNMAGHVWPRHGHYCARPLNWVDRPYGDMATSASAFFLPGECNDPGYAHVRDNECWRFARDFTEELWIAYRPFADPHFLEEAKHQFLQRFWEMYLTCALLRHGFSLERVGSEGPEFYFVSEGRRVWVEAIAPGPGDGPDRVPEPKSREVNSVSDEKILLRFTSALVEKQGRDEVALRKGIVQPGDQMLLAINSRGIPYAPAGAEIPYVLKAFLPFGALTHVVDRKTMEVRDSYHQFRDRVVKAKGAPVATTSFLNPEFGAFVAVLHSSVDCANHPPALGEDFLVLRNPMACGPLPKGLFSWCRQFELQGESLHEMPASGL